MKKQTIGRFTATLAVAAFGAFSLLGGLKATASTNQDTALKKEAMNGACGTNINVSPDFDVGPAIAPSRAIQAFGDITRPAFDYGIPATIVAKDPVNVTTKNTAAVTADDIAYLCATGLIKKLSHSPPATIAHHIGTDDIDTATNAPPAHDASDQAK